MSHLNIRHWRGGEHLFNQTAQTFHYLKQRVASGELVLKCRSTLFFWSDWSNMVTHEFFETLSPTKTHHSCWVVCQPI